MLCYFFFFNDTATTEIYTLSLHDALPICLSLRRGQKPTRESNCPVDALRTRRLEAPGLDDLQDLLIDAATDELHRTHGHCGALWRNQHVNDSRTLPSVTGCQTTVLRDRAVDT